MERINYVMLNEFEALSCEVIVCLFFSPVIDIRLADGLYPNQGRLEILIDGHLWGTVCNKEWTLVNSMVICQHLGYEPRVEDLTYLNDMESSGDEESSGNEDNNYFESSYDWSVSSNSKLMPEVQNYYPSVSFGPGTGPVFLLGMECLGNETNINQCKHSRLAASRCSHEDDVGVVCHSNMYPNYGKC